MGLDARRREHGRGGRRGPGVAKRGKIRRSDLPFGSEFSPSQIELPRVLEFAKRRGGDWRAFENDVRITYFESHKASEYNRRKLANNTKLGMQAYGIIDKQANLTDFGRELFALRTDDDKLFDRLARHILLHLHGATLVQCVLDIQTAGESVTLVKLREWLDERGVHFPSGGKHPSIMRLWLEKAGVFESGWRVNESRFRQLLGTTIRELEVLSAFTSEQKAYLRTLANMGPGGPYLSNEIARLATGTYGTKFNEKNLPKQVLYPLERTGYIALRRGTKKPGRGAKPFLVMATKKLVADIVSPLLAQLEKQTAADIRPLLRKPLALILKELKHRDRHKRGLALEALAFKLMRLIDMTYVATRLRGAATGGAEVDLIFESCRLVFSRWQIQCKNTKYVALDDVAKEVGITRIFVIVTTGKVGGEARAYANKVMSDSNLCIAMMDGGDLADILDNPAHVVDIFNREAKQAMKLKALDL